MEAFILSDRVQFISKAETVTFRGLDMLSGNVQNTSVPPSATVRPTVRIILAPEMLAAYPSGYYDVDLRVITNQPTWTEKPSTEGAFNCLDDLTPLFRKEPSSSGGGQVDTIVPGDAIDVDSTDPANPIVNVKVDGVTMLVNGSNELEAVASGGITQLTGPVTAGPGSGSQATTITNGAVTFAKMQPVSANILLGNDAAGTAVEEIPCTPFARTILDDVDAAAVRATIGAGTGTGTVTAVSVASANGLAGSSSGGATPALTLSTTVTGILEGNGTAISAAATTGSGSVVLATSPALVTPDIGVPSAGTLTNATGLPPSTGLTAPYGAHVVASYNMGVPICMFGTTGTLTNQLSTLAFFPMSFVYLGPRLDLTGFAEVKFQACVITGSASANTPKIILRYFTSYSTTTTDYLDIGTSEVSCSLTTAGVIETAFIPLAAGAIGTNKFLRLLMSGGDNDKDPVVGLVTAFFR